MKKLLMLCAVIASMGMSCPPIEPPASWGPGFGHYCPPGGKCANFPAEEHGNGGPAA